MLPVGPLVIWGLRLIKTAVQNVNESLPKATTPEEHANIAMDLIEKGNDAEAIKHLQIAAEAGIASAQHNLGNRYNRGWAYRRIVHKPRSGISWPRIKDIRYLSTTWRCCATSEMGFPGIPRKRGN
jgi:hypothetical protein